MGLNILYIEKNLEGKLWDLSVYRPWLHWILQIKSDEIPIFEPKREKKNPFIDYVRV